MSEGDEAPRTVCRAFISATAVIGAPCGSCGHTNLVHSVGQVNRVANDECQVCRVEVLADKMQRFTEKLREAGVLEEDV